jgi:hypothetical protein
MKRVLLKLLAVVLLVDGGVAHAANGCDFNISGIWESEPATSGDPPAPVRYRFGADGIVVTLSRVVVGDGAQWQEAARAPRFYYRLDDPRAPSKIEFHGPDGLTLRGSMEVSQFDDGSFTTLDANSVATRWMRVDAERHFVVFAASLGDVAKGGPAFATLIVTDAEGGAHSDSFGIYLAQDMPIVGPIPAELSRRFMTESRLDSDVMLRLELTGAEYARAFTILQSWERRAREHTMLYEVPYLNNIVFVEQMAVSLNKCSNRVRVQKLNWNVGDKITAIHNLPQVPFFYIRELRRQNDPLHLGNEEFRRRMGSACGGDCSAPARLTQIGAPAQQK